MVMYYTIEDYEPVDFPDENKRIFSSEDDKEHFEIENGVLIRYTGNKTTVSVPDGVVEIGSKAFQYSYYVKNIILPDSVIKIADHAFFKCSALENVNIPTGVTGIGNSAFEECLNLKEIDNVLIFTYKYFIYL